MPLDPYSVLGVAKSASEDEIKKAYRSHARQYHPDRNPGDKGAESKFKEVQDAYEILGDKDKKVKFDQVGHQDPNSSFGGGGNPFGQGSMNMDDLAQMFGGAGGGQGFNFGDMFGAKKGRSTRTRKAPPQSQIAQLGVDFLIAANGGKLGISFGGKNIDVMIPEGAADGQKLRMSGQGEGGSDLILELKIEPHPYFKRQGNDILLDCPLGLVEVALGTSVDVPSISGARVTVKFPPGISSGKRLRLKGLGIKGGDQFVEVKIVPPPVTDSKSRELLEEFAKHHPQDVRVDLKWA